jgi:creatinine amidohydrolase
MLPRRHSPFGHSVPARPISCRLLAGAGIRPADICHNVCEIAVDCPPKAIYPDGPPQQGLFMPRVTACFLAASCAALLATTVQAADRPNGVETSETNPLWHHEKIRNYLPDMTWPEVADLLTRSDMVIIPVASLEQHALHGPIGTDFYNSNERAKLIAQRTDVLVAPILLPGNSPYHMGFPGTITLSADTIQRVYFEAVQSLLQHGFKRFLFINGHGGNAAITKFIVDRVNQETAGIAVDLNEAAAPYRKRTSTAGITNEPKGFDRHAGTPETSASLYYTPNLVELSAARAAKITLPPHMKAMLPKVIARDPTAERVFLAEGLKAKETGKHTSTREMSDTGTWGEFDPKLSTLARGRATALATIDADVAFIESWMTLRPLGAK